MSALRPPLLAPRTPPEPTVPVEAAERVLSYLIFHRSLIDDAAAPAGPPALLERYLALVRDLREGIHVVISDPVQKATALLFELVINEAFDPWEIDLVRFTQAYLERIRTQDAFDFAVSGRLVYMAWSILYLQSDELLHLRAGPAAPSPGPESLADTPDDVAVDGGYLGELGSPEAAAVTSAVLDRSADPPLEEMVCHTETRPVSLLELVSAFDTAEAEARRSLHIEELRERLREQQRAPPEVLVHGDVPERDLADAWNTCLRHPIREEFPFLELWRATEGRDRLVAVFLASLFLARENVLELYQVELGVSDVRLARTGESRPVRAGSA